MAEEGQQMARQPLVVANWKMHKTETEAKLFVDQFAGEALPAGVQIVICPSFTAIPAVAAALAGCPWQVGAQNCHEADAGAFTGEVSAAQLHAAGCAFVIVGHSERRRLFGETDAAVRAKLEAALGAGLRPIVCVGETAEQRAAGETEAVVAGQVRAAVSGLAPEQARQLVIAYEPVWAIGTGQTPTADDAQGVSAVIRRLLGELAGPDAAAAVPVLYGGSVNGDNAAAFAAQPDIDGALVGGASLQPEGFGAIVRAFAQ